MRANNKNKENNKEKSFLERKKAELNNKIVEKYISDKKEEKIKEIKTTVDKAGVLVKGTYDAVKDKAETSIAVQTGKVFVNTTAKKISNYFSTKARTVERDLQYKASEGDEYSQLLLNIKDSAEKGVNVAKSFYDSLMKKIDSTHKISDTIPGYKTLIDVMEKESKNTGKKGYSMPPNSDGVSIELNKDVKNRWNQEKGFFKFSKRKETTIDLIAEYENEDVKTECEIKSTYMNDQTPEFSKLLKAIGEDAKRVINEELSYDDLKGNESKNVFSNYSEIITTKIGDQTFEYDLVADFKDDRLSVVYTSKPDSSLNVKYTAQSKPGQIPEN